MTSNDKRYRSACLRWKEKLGLHDWNFLFTDEQPAEGIYASVSFDWQARHAIFSAWTRNKRNTFTPEEGARHEVLHVLLYDLMKIIEVRADSMHADALREEHRVIQRLQEVLP